MLDDHIERLETITSRSGDPRKSLKLLSAQQVADLGSQDPIARETAWAAFYPRARVIAASKLRNHYGLRAKFDDQDIDDTVDAAIGILYRRCVLSTAENPVRQPYALLVSICVHLLPKAWKKRKRDREIVALIAAVSPGFSFPIAVDEYDPCAHSHASGLAHWLLVQLDKRQAKMPREIKAGLLGTLFKEAGLLELLDDVLDRFPEARRRHCRMYHYEGHTTNEIAERCGCGPSNISNNLRRSWLVFQSSPEIRQGLEEIAFVGPVDCVAGSVDKA